VAAADGHAIALVREADGERALVAVNAGRTPARLDIAADLATGLRAVDLPGMPAGQVVGGTAIEIPAQGALVLA
jgi:hypothetical protein